MTALPQTIPIPATRVPLPNRREAEHFQFTCGGIQYIASIGRFDNGGLAEIFIFSGKAGSQADVSARDAAVVASIALQYGVPLDVMRHALVRDPRGEAGSPLGVALDILASEIKTSD